MFPSYMLNFTIYKCTLLLVIYIHDFESVICNVTLRCSVASIAFIYIVTDYNYDDDVLFVPNFFFGTNNFRLFSRLL